MICEQCQNEMKLIPAGTSKKTGKPYKSFWSCPNGHTAPYTTYAGSTAPKAAITKAEPDWDKIAVGKVRHGLVCAMIENGWSYDRVVSELDAFVEIVMGAENPF